jgi:hypothetical protein
MGNGLAIVNSIQAYGGFGAVAHGAAEAVRTLKQLFSGTYLCGACRRIFYHFYIFT